MTETTSKLINVSEEVTADLYAALLAVESAITAHNISRKAEGHGCPWDFAEGFGGALDQARAALAKARGES